MTVTTTVEGRERYSVLVRYPRDLRDSPDALRRILVPVQLGSAGAAPAGGAMGAAGMPGASRVVHIPLGQLADVRVTGAPMQIRTENAFLTSWVQVDFSGSDLGGYVRQARAAVDSAVTLPAGYRLVWSGQYESLERARAKLILVVPVTLAIIVVLLYLNFRNVRDVVIVLFALPLALVGGFWLLWLLGYELSVAVVVGFIALFGVAAETGVVMLIYLDLACAAAEREGPLTADRLHDAVVHGAAERLRPKMMTVLAIMGGLLPIMWGEGTGGSVMRRIAAPMIGGMVSSTVLTLVAIPALYLLWRRWELARAARGGGTADPRTG
jgi:Cu(I)/Ag(I) efflux system membrane protein CusA/SilA